MPLKKNEPENLSDKTKMGRHNVTRHVRLRPTFMTNRDDVAPPSSPAAKAPNPLESSETLRAVRYESAVFHAMSKLLKRSVVLIFLIICVESA